MNPGINKLQPYPFEKLAFLQAGITPASHRPVDLSIGEPKHPPPRFILRELAGHLQSVGEYPAIKGGTPLRAAIRDWLIKRYKLPPRSLDANEHILPVNGTREALFAIAHCMLSTGKKDAMVITGNPFYQIYEGAALLAGGTVGYAAVSKDTAYLPDYRSVPADEWEKCQVLYVCSPNNPTGAVVSQAAYQTLFALADRHDFIIAADECYSEIYPDEKQPPTGILEAAYAAGRDDFSRCIAFHSLSKRSNVPGMRSGFVAGNRELIGKFYRYRTYHGCSMAPYTQAASAAAWRDETHVLHNRRLYREKFDAVIDILAPVMTLYRPEAGFYLWPETPIDDVAFTAALYEQQNVKVLPGSFTSREANGMNPGKNRLRIALVAALDDCVEAARRIRSLIETL